MNYVTQYKLALIAMAAALPSCNREGESAKAAMLSDSDTVSVSEPAEDAGKPRPQPEEPPPGGEIQGIGAVEDTIARRRQASLPTDRPVPQPQEPRP
jgi:hypothetical protein